MIESKQKLKKNNNKTKHSNNHLWLSLTAQFVNRQQNICHVLASPPSTMTHQMGFLHHLQWEPKTWTLIMTIWSLCGEWNVWSGEKEIIAGNAAALTLTLDLYYSRSIRIWAATHVPSWRMWTWSTTALWLNSPQEWRQFPPLISDPKWFQSRAQAVSWGRGVGVQWNDLNVTQWNDLNITQSYDQY